MVCWRSVEFQHGKPGSLGVFRRTVRVCLVVGNSFCSFRSGKRALPKIQRLFLWKKRGVSQYLHSACRRVRFAWTYLDFSGDGATANFFVWYGLFYVLRQRHIFGTVSFQIPQQNRGRNKFPFVFPGYGTHRIQHDCVNVKQCAYVFANGVTFLLRYPFIAE